MPVIRNATVGGAAGLLIGAVAGLALGVVGSMVFDVYLALTIEEPSPESLGPLFAVFTGAAMGLAVGIPTGLMVGAVLGVCTGVERAWVKAVMVGVFVGVLVCTVMMIVGIFFPPPGYSSVPVGGGITVAAGAIAGVAAGKMVRWSARWNHTEPS